MQDTPPANGRPSLIKNLWNLNSLLYLALVLALVASLEHVAFAFSTVNGGNWTEAYISAIAIDLGLLALAAGINKRKSERRATWSLWAGVILFSAISTYANWLAGISHVVPLKADTDSFLVSLRPLFLSGVLPLLVIYLSEIVSGNYQVDQAAAQKQAKKEAKRTGSSANKPPSEQSPEERQANLNRANEVRKPTQADFDLSANLKSSGLTWPQVANELGVSGSTAKRWAERAQVAEPTGNGAEQ